MFQDEPPQAKNLTSELPASQTIPFLKQRLPSPWHLSLEVPETLPKCDPGPRQPYWGGWGRFSLLGGLEADSRRRKVPAVGVPGAVSPSTAPAPRLCQSH